MLPKQFSYSTNFGSLKLTMSLSFNLQIIRAHVDAFEERDSYSTTFNFIMWNSREIYVYLVLLAPMKHYP